MKALEAELNHEQHLADEMAQYMEIYLNNFHSRPSQYYTEVDLLLHQMYADAIKREKRPNFKGLPYFSPSSVGSCPRELYMKTKGAKKDVVPREPHQARWTDIGTAIGDTAQKWIMCAETVYETPTFRFERNQFNEPMFEEFAKIQKPIIHNGEEFWLYGTCDGIMLFTHPVTGEEIRVGLEVKSKQTTNAATGYWSMKNADPKHVEQCKAYSIMYGLDYYIIMYVNGSKKGWNMSEEDKKKYPDIRTFGVHITDEDRVRLLDGLAGIVKNAREDFPPVLMLTRWTFNNFKEACALSLSELEMDLLREWLGTCQQNKKLKPYQVKSYIEAYEHIERIREAGEYVA